MGNNKKGQQPEKPRDDAAKKADKSETPADVPPLVDALGELFAKYGVKLATASFVLPDKGSTPHVFYVGEFYDVAKLAARTHRQFLQQIQSELG
jgi:hypothetical protein